MKKSALVCIITACIGWGTSGLFVHWLSPYGFTSIHMTFMRSVVMLITMLAYVLVYDRTLFKISLPGLILAFAGGLGFFGTASCYYYAMIKTSVSTAVVLMYTAPIFIMIYSVLFLGEKLTKLKLVSVMGMLLGCLMVSGVIGGFTFDLHGIMFGLLSGISFSVYNILTKIQMKKDINPVTANLYGFLFATVVGVFVGDIGAIPLCIEKNIAITIPLVILMGIFTSAMPYLCYSTALKTIPAGTASSLSVLEPMAATVFSIAFLSEKPQMLPALGIVLMLVSVFMLSKEKE